MSDENKPFVVVEVIDPYRCAINKGSEDGVQIGQRLLVYGLGKEIFDPISGDSLGVLEVVRGRGKVTHVQPRLATIETYEREEKSGRIIRKNPFGSIWSDTVEEVGNTILKTFEDIEVGDLAKFI